MSSLTGTSRSVPALQKFGAPYINALRNFEKWEADQNKERASAAEGKTKRLANGQVPSSRSRAQPTKKKLTDEEAFFAGFDEAKAEVAR